MIVVIAAMAGITVDASAQKRSGRRAISRNEQVVINKQGFNNTSSDAIKVKRNRKKSARATFNTGKAQISGKISHDNWEGDKKTSVSFNGFPATIDEWKEMQNILGSEPQGAVALQVMAFELYRNNREDGEQALRLNNTSTNFNSTVGRLRELMGKDKYYARPYLAQAMLRDATPENGYTTRPPFYIDIKVDPNKKYQESQLLKGTVIYLMLYSKGWDTNWRGVEVVKPEGSDYFVVSNCPAIYTQCKEAK